MALVQVVYRVPVLCLVDTERREDAVVDVRVFDEEVEFAGEFTDDNGNPLPAGAAESEAALALAEAGEWPRWRFG